MMNLNYLYNKALQLEPLSIDEGAYLFRNAPMEDLMHIGFQLRQKHVPGNIVTWMIDRNVNITNVCVARCKFCNFHRIPGHPESYITTLEQYREKIESMMALGGYQLLLQGGLHPKLGLTYYKELFSALKSTYPMIKLHALGPAEIVHISKMGKMSYSDVLTELKTSGLESLPGAGAEILVDRVRKAISPGKCSSQEWLDVMHEAHKLNLVTSATMMFGHIETIEERMEHMVKLRETQAKKPEGTYGFTAFIAWPFQDDGTVLQKKMGINNFTDCSEYLRMIAISRIMLTNITNIQASWLTVGKGTAQLALHAGANDMGSIMIEENVVSAAGATHWLDSESMKNTIIDARFTPQLRDQKYSLINE